MFDVPGQKHGLRRGDAVTGACGRPRDGEAPDKYTRWSLAHQWMEPDEAAAVPSSTSSTPLYPQSACGWDEPHILTTRSSIASCRSQGQRALIVSPPKAARRWCCRAIANAITHNNPSAT